MDGFRDDPQDVPFLDCVQKKFYRLKGVGAAHKNQKCLEIIVLRAGQPLALRAFPFQGKGIGTCTSKFDPFICILIG